MNTVTISRELAERLLKTCEIANRVSVFEVRRRINEDVAELRAALDAPSGWRPIETAPDDGIQWDESYKGCICHRCIRENDIRMGALPLSSARMIVCPTCGNKRCPHASDHEIACTGSNAPGQPGSVFAATGPTDSERLDAAMSNEKKP